MANTGNIQQNHLIQFPMKIKIDRPRISFIAKRWPSSTIKAEDIAIWINQENPQNTSEDNTFYRFARNKTKNQGDPECEDLNSDQPKFQSGLINPAIFGVHNGGWPRETYQLSWHQFMGFS